MLGKNDTIEGVDLGAALHEMLNDLSWKALRALILSTPQLQKACTLGGHRLDAKRRKRMTQRIVREAEKAEFAPSFVNGIFAQWYPVHADLHDRLEGYFHSDEYSTVREEQDLAEDSYVLSDAKFEEFFRVEELPQWRLLLCFSPLAFTPAQADKILGGQGDSEALLDKLKRLEEKLESARREKQSQESELERLRREHDKATTTAQESRRERRELSTEVKALQQKFDASQVENRKLREKIDETEARCRQAAEKTREDKDRELTRLRSELEDVREECEAWRARYEEQCGESRAAGEQMREQQQALRAAEADQIDTNRELEELSRFADLILSKIDWVKVGSQMRMTPTVKRQFNSLVRKLDYEEDRSLTIQGTLPEFWKRLLDRETLLIEAIAKSENAEVISGGVEAFWRGLTDDFEDVRISLEARGVLLGMLQEIFYQTLRIEDLNEARVPVGRK